MRLLVDNKIRKIIKSAILEDLGEGDITTFLTVPDNKYVSACIIVNEEGVLCGKDIVVEVFKTIDPKIQIRFFKKDSDKIYSKEVVAEIRGKAASILKGERVALNFLSRLSGISSYTNKFVNLVKDTKVKIRDTRKTTPNMRILEKYAVRVGGGENHRLGLWDGVLIKDNHLRCAEIITVGSIREDNLDNLMKVIRKVYNKEIEIEVENFREFVKVIKYKPDILLLDNFSLKDIRKAVEYRNNFYPDIRLEVSGKIDLNNVKKIALFGVDYISLGCITHSIKSLDFSLEVMI